MEAGIILSAVEAIGDYGAKIQSPLLSLPMVVIIYFVIHFLEYLKHNP